MRDIFKIIGFLLGITNFLFAISFAKTYGGGSSDSAYSIQQTMDGGYIIAGWTTSFGAGGNDCLIIKLNSKGDVEWGKTFGGGGHDHAYSIQQTMDGGYIVAGGTQSFGAGGNDFLVIKLNSQGNVEWTKTFGGVGGYESAYFIQQTIDGGYIVAGMAGVATNDCDILIIKLNSQGNVEWVKRFDMPATEDYDIAYSIHQTSDNGYIVAGYTWSVYGSTWQDFLIIKLNSQGDIEWAKTFEGGGEDMAYSIRQTSDGGYIVTGFSWSFGASTWGDFLVIKLTPEGNVEWAKTVGGGNIDCATSIQQTIDGGYIVAGWATSFGGRYEADFLVIKLNSQGDKEWAKIFGGEGDDMPYFIQQTNDSGYIVAGRTTSFGAGSWDFLVIKTQDGQMASDCPWYECPTTPISRNISLNSVSVNVMAPSVTTFSPSISTFSPSISTFEVCSTVVAEENIYFPEENIKLESSIFLKDKISLKFSGYSKEKIKLVLYDILGNEIISKSFDFGNYVEIKDKRIEKIKKGIYFLKIYLREKEIGRLKMIRE